MHQAPRSKLASLKNWEASALQKDICGLAQWQRRQVCIYWGMVRSLAAFWRSIWGTSLGDQMVQVLSPEYFFASLIARATLLSQRFCVQRTPDTISLTCAWSRSHVSSPLSCEKHFPLYVIYADGMCSGAAHTGFLHLLGTSCLSRLRWLLANSSLVLSGR